MRALVTTVVAIIAITVIAIAYFDLKLMYKQDNTSAIDRSLADKITVLRDPQFPNNVLSGVYIPDTQLNAVLRELTSVSTTFTPASPHWVGPLALSVLQLQVGSEPGINSIQFKLKVQSAKYHVTAYLKAKGILTVAGLGTTDKFGRSLVRIRILPSELRPEVSFANLAFFASGPLANALINQAAQYLAATYLQFTLPATFKNPLLLPSSASFRVKIGSPNAFTAFAASLSGGNAFAPKSTLRICPIAHGTWLFAVANGDTPTPPASSANGAMPGSTNKVNTYMSLLKKLIGASPRAKTASFFVDHNLFDKFLQSYISSGGSGRTISIRMTGYQGHWYHHPYGGAPLNVTLDVYPRSATATIRVLPSRFTWSRNSGVIYDIPLNMSAKVPLTAYVQPVVGGFPVEVTLNGGVNAILKGDLKPEISSAGGRSERLILENIPQCSIVAPVVSTGGSIPIGLKYPIQLADLTNTTVSADMLPRLLAFTIDLPKNGRVSLNRRASVAARSIPIEMAIQPTALTLTNEGLLAAVTVSTSPGALHAAANAVHHSASSSGVDTRCRAAGGPALLVAGVEFGPNNDLVKFLVALGGVAKQGADLVKKLIDGVPAVIGRANAILRQAGIGPEYAPLLVRPGPSRFRPQPSPSRRRLWPPPLTTRPVCCNRRDR